MSAFTVESSHPVRVEAGDDQPITLLNNGDTLYYKQDSGVSSTNNDGSLTSGQQIELTIPTWIRSASASYVQTIPNQAVAGNPVSFGSNPPVQLLSSTTYGNAVSFGNVPGSFTFGGTGSPADIFAPLVIYQKYGATNPNANITKTTQAFFAAASYYGPATDDGMECGSTFVGAKDTGTPYTQSKAVTAFEGHAQVEGGNTASGGVIGIAGRISVLGTSHVTSATAVHSGAIEKDAGATFDTFYAFRQAAAGPATTNYAFYGIDQVISESSLWVHKSGNGAKFAADISGPSAFVEITSPDSAGTTPVMRLNMTTGQTGALITAFNAAGTNCFQLGRLGGLFTVTGLFVQDTIGGNTLFTVDSAGLPNWMAAGNQQTTVGAAGAASALPAAPTKYLKIKDSGGTTLVVPAYAAS